MRYALFLVLAISSALGQDGRNCHIERWNGATALLLKGDGWSLAEDLRIVCETIKPESNPVAAPTLSQWKLIAIPTTNPEPMDIPAIKNTKQCGPPSYSCPTPDIYGSGTLSSPPETWTCPKGSGRVLLTDVDQGHHCVLFPK